MDTLVGNLIVVLLALACFIVALVAGTFGVVTFVDGIRIILESPQFPLLHFLVAGGSGMLLVILLWFGFHLIIYELR